MDCKVIGKTANLNSRTWIHGHTTDMLRTAAALTALVAWLALALQLVLITDTLAAEGRSFIFAVWRFLGFFTILTNGLVAIVTTMIAAGRITGLAGSRIRLVTVTAISLVGIVYSVALRDIWDPDGWQAIADHALHDATPPLFVLIWLLSAHGGLAWKESLWALAPPLGYCGYAITRGAADGWYAYWFFDPNSQSLTQIAASIAVLLTAFFAVALVFVAIDRRLASRLRGDD